MIQTVARIFTSLSVILALVLSGISALYPQPSESIPIISGDGDELCRIPPFTAGSGPNCTAQTISVDPRWQPNNPNGFGGQWISFADTGYLGTTLAIPRVPNTPSSMATVMQIRQDFLVQAGETLLLDVWADDTVSVSLFTPSGSDFVGAPFDNLINPDFIDNVCPSGQPGCAPDGKSSVQYFFEDGGAFRLFFSVFQTGIETTNTANPFGLLFSGQTVDDLPPPTPPTTPPPLLQVSEPTTIVLFGFGLVSLIFVGRRRTV